MVPPSDLDDDMFKNPLDDAIADQLASGTVHPEDAPAGVRPGGDPPERRPGDHAGPDSGPGRGGIQYCCHHPACSRALAGSDRSDPSEDLEGLHPQGAGHRPTRHRPHRRQRRRCYWIASGARPVGCLPRTVARGDLRSLGHGGGSRRHRPGQDWVVHCVRSRPDPRSGLRPQRGFRQSGQGGRR